jgi:Disulphide bond corrector protein DsbC
MKWITYTVWFLLAFQFASAQELKPLKWAVTSAQKEAKAGDVITIEFKAKIEKKWILYASESKVEGPLPTTVKFIPNGDFELDGKLLALNPLTKYDDIWEGEVSYFEKKGVFLQKIKILKPHARIEGEIKALTCSNADGKCIANQNTFSFSF